MEKFTVAQLEKAYAVFSKERNASPGDPDGYEFILWLKTIRTLPEATFNSISTRKFNVVSRDLVGRVMIAMYREKLT